MQTQMQIFSALHSGSVVAGKSLWKWNCNVLVIGILYNGETEGIDCGFPCFLPEYDAVFHAQKIAKKDCPFLLFLPDFGCVMRPINPISLPSAPLF